MIVGLHKSQTHEIDNWNDRIALQFDKRLLSSIVEKIVEFQNDHSLLNAHLTTWKIDDVLC